VSDPPDNNDPDAGIDPRVRRTRTALLTAAVTAVTEHGSTELSVTELADTAGVSRRVLYQHFGDLNGLLVTAAIELMTREMAPAMTELARATADPAAEHTVPMTEFATHFATHRRFYRALLTGSCAYSVHRRMGELFAPFSQAAARHLFGDLDDDLATEIGTYFTAGTTMSFAAWLIDSPDPLDPQQFVEHLNRIQTVLARTPPSASAPSTTLRTTTSARSQP